MSTKILSGIFIKGVCFLAILMPVCAQSTTANTLQHPRDQIALQLGAIQMGYTTAGTAFQLVTGNATNAQQAANALLMGRNALDATVAKPAVKVQGAVDSPAVDTVEYRDQLYSAVEHVVTSPAAGAIRGLVTLEGGKKVAAVARLVAPPNSWTVPVPYALEARSSADAQVLSVQVVDLQTQAATLTSNLTLVQGKLSGVSSNVTTLTSNVTNLLSQTGGLSSNVTALQTQTAGLGSNLTAVQGQLSGVASNVTTLTSNVTTLQTQTGSLSSNVSTLQTQASGLTSNLSGLRQDLAASAITEPAAVTTFAGSGDLGYADGSGVAAVFKGPVGVASDSTGNLYVADPDNHRIRKISAAGVVTTLAGSGVASYADGTGNAAAFNVPTGVAVDGTGNVYVADQSNNRIRKISPAGVVTTLAGSGTAGFANGNGTAAVFKQPQGVAVDSAGNVYVADSNNHRIRKISPAGVVTTLAGSGTAGFSEGNGTAAGFNAPRSLVLDGADNVYVADSNNHRIRKISAAGLVSTLAGSGNATYADSTGASASFNLPYGLGMDAAGNLYVGDSGNNRIRKVSPAGVVTTLAGSGNAAFADGMGVAASFNSPAGLAVDGTGNVYVADRSNSRIRKMQTQFASLASNLGSVQGQVNGVSANVSTLTSGLATTQNQTATLSSDVSNLQNQTGSLSTNVTALQTQTAGLGSNLTVLTSNVTNLQAQTSNNTIQISEFDKFMSIFLARDYDGDGVNEYRELKDGTDPNNAVSFDPLSKDLVAYYPFNGNAKDHSGYGLDRSGEIIFGKNRFNELEASCAAANLNGLPVFGENGATRTVSFWLKVKNFAPIDYSWPGNPITGQRNSVVLYGPMGPIGFTDNGYLHMDSGNGVSLFEMGNLYGEWNQIVISYSGSIKAAKVYKNGNLVPLAWWGMGPKETIVDSWLSNFIFNAQGEFELDELKIYKRALSDAEVSQLYTNESIGMMITVQGGTLPQGSGLAGQSVATFQIGKYELTWGEWKTVRDWAVANGYTDLANIGDGKGDNHPVRNVHWYDVVKWCNAKSEMEGLTPVYQVGISTYKTGQSIPTIKSAADGYRLPLEKEWEWAAGGGVNSKGYIYSGSNNVDAVAWYNGDANSNSDGTKAVGTKQGNELGIYDMSGNIWEWVFDSNGYYRRIRGGSWDTYPSERCSITFRDGEAYPDARGYKRFGFRLARNATLNTLRIRALIDGPTQLTLGVEGIRWYHSDWTAVPGRHEGRNEPTYLNNDVWYPDWPELGENRGYEAFSSYYNGLDIAPFLSAPTISLQLSLARDSVSISRQYASGNLFTTLNFDDLSFFGSDYYDLTISTIDGSSPQVTASPIASPILLGQSLSNSSLTGGVASLNGVLVEGHFAFAKPEFQPAAGNSTQLVVFTSANSLNYSVVTTVVPVNILNHEGDEDFDSVINRDELAFGTDPFKADTDGDGVNDGVELKDGTDPNNPYSFNELSKGQGVTIYVNQNATGANNGTSWTDAYTNLDSALSSAHEGDAIWIAAGTYKPSSNGNIDAYFSVSKSISIFGGFSGTETTLNQRDWTANPAILSGDLVGDDIGPGSNQYDNSKRVIVVANTSGVLIDGISITGGNCPAPGVGPDSGAGLDVFSSITIRNCKFYWNYAISYGGGLAIRGEGVQSLIENCSFTNNVGDWNGGGAMFVESASATIKNSYFANNSGSRGGAVQLNGAQNIRFENSVFVSNYSRWGLGSDGGGAIWIFNGPGQNLEIIHCTFLNNSNLRGSGGAIRLDAEYDSGSTFIANSIFAGSGQNAILNFQGTITNNLFDSALSGITISLDTPTFTDPNDPLGSDGVFGTRDDGLVLSPASKGLRAAMSSHALELDVTGRKRPASADVGAYQTLYVDNSSENMVAVQGGTLPEGSELAGQTVATFQIGKYEVTWGEWKTMREWAVANSYTDLAGAGEGSGDDHPVQNVSWYDVVKWINAKSQMEGLTPVYQANGATFKSGQIEPTINSAANGYRLPTDAEWEWAARGGVLSQGYTYSGSNDLDAVAWYIYNSGSTTHEIGTKASNELGIFDMSGNAWEWVFDAYDGSLRRVRGTGFGNHEDSAAVANRDGRANPDYRYYDGGRNGVGFRLARNAPSMHSTDTFGTGNNTFDLEFVSIGNPMNAADPDTNLGSVSYPYRISKYTISQKNWDKAVSSGLQNASSSTDHGGVGLAGENTPTNNVSWYEAAAFVNWLNTSKGYQPAYNLTFSNGAWSMLLWSVEGSWSQGGVNRYRHKNAHYFLPSDNEWYKAAYYDPNKPGGAGYWMYPTGSDTPPEQVSNTGTGKGGAGWNYGGAGTDPGTTVYGLASWSAPADINACGGLSPYGTMGQGGNVAQWVETSSNGLNSDPQAQRRAMGYAYYFDSSHLGKTGDYETKNLSPQNDVGGTVGIRVGSKKD